MDNSFLGTEMKLFTFILIVIEGVILYSQLMFYIQKPSDKSRLRFVGLTLMFVIYNLISGFLPDENFGINLFLQNVVSIGIGIALAIYYYAYLVKELNMIQDKYFSVKNLIIGLVGTFVLGFGLSYLTTNDLNKSRQYYIFLPIIIAVYFCIKTILFLFKKSTQYSTNKTPFKYMITSGYVGIVFMATMPIVVAFGDYQIVNNGLVNVSFFLSYIAFFKYMMFHSKIESEMLIVMNKKSEKDKLKLGNCENFNSYCLSKRQIEIAYLMLENFTYAEIGKELFISTNTASKHGSDILKKTNMTSKSQFIAKFS